MRKRIFRSRTRSVLFAVAPILGAICLTSWYCSARVEGEASPSESTSQAKATQGISALDKETVKNISSPGANHRKDEHLQIPSSVSALTSRSLLTDELASTDEHDLAKLAEISRQSLSCRARREVLKSGDAFEQDIAAAKTDDARFFLQKEYEAFLPRLKKAEADKDAQCDGLSDTDLEIVARESTLRAAALGDTDAQMCAMFVLPDVYAVSSEKQQAVIGNQAANYLSAGLDRGDWRAVRLFQNACGPHAGVQGLGLACEGLPILRMQIILALGASGEKQKELMEDIERITAEVDSTGSLQLQGKSHPKKEVDSAIDWAKAEYAKHFRNSSYDFNQPVCISQGYGLGG